MLPSQQRCPTSLRVAPGPLPISTGKLPLSTPPLLPFTHPLTRRPARPQDAAPFSSTYHPTQRLSFLLGGASAQAGEGGSQGVWVLGIEDLAPNPDK